jgi:hypothetical protein
MDEDVYPALTAVLLRFSRSICATQNLVLRSSTELYWLKGELLLLRSLTSRTEVEACFRYALDVAQRQQAKLLELYAALSLGGLWWQQVK